MRSLSNGTNVYLEKKVRIGGHSLRDLCFGTNEEYRGMPCKTYDLLVKVQQLHIIPICFIVIVHS